MSKVIAHETIITTPATTPVAHSYKGTATEFKKQANALFESFLSPDRNIEPAAKSLALTIHRTHRDEYLDSGIGYGGNTYIIPLQSMTELTAIFTIPAFRKEDLESFLKGEKKTIDFQRCLDGTGNLSPSYLNQLIRIITHFSTNLVNEIVVWFNPETKQFEVIDGGHTIIILILLHFGAFRVKELYARTREEAIDAYNRQSDYSTAINSAQRAIGELAVHNKMYMDIFQILYKQNININGYAVNNNVTAKSFDTLTLLYKNHGKVALERVVKILIGCFGVTDKKALNKPYIMMFDKIYDYIYSENCQNELLNLVAAMKCYTAKGFMDEAAKALEGKVCGPYKTEPIEAQLVAYAKIIMGIACLDDYPNK